MHHIFEVGLIICRRVQFGFKFWLAGCAVMAAVICVTGYYPYTTEWRLYLAYITVIALMMERVVSFLSLSLIGLRHGMKCKSLAQAWIEFKELNQ